jgi:hypothetical protein
LLAWMSTAKQSLSKDLEQSVELGAVGSDTILNCEGGCVLDALVMSCRLGIMACAACVPTQMFATQKSQEKSERGTGDADAETGAPGTVYLLFQNSYATFPGNVSGVPIPVPTDRRCK